jgi:FkbM family methyltransferase
MNLLRLIVAADDSVVDVGGNRGIYAYKFWRLGARVEVFEPNPICFRVLTAWCVNKRSVNVHAIALSSCLGHASLHIPIDETGVEHDASASIESTGFLQARDEIVALQTLDSYCFDEVKFIKIDVEGHEAKVISGATNTIILAKPAILVEIEQRHCDFPISNTFNQIRALGYKGFFLRGNVIVSLDDFDVEKDQAIVNLDTYKELYINNFLFLPQSKLDGGEYSNFFRNMMSK